MGCVNKVTLIGNVARDPTIRETGAGDEIVCLTIDTHETWRDKSTGEKRQRIDRHEVVVFNEHCRRIARTLTPGSRVYLQGALQRRTWTDGEGTEHSTLEVVLGRYKSELISLDPRPAAAPVEDAHSDLADATP